MKDSILGNGIIHNDMLEIYQRGYEWERFRNKKVLITGSYGMIASYLVFYFAYLNYLCNMSVKIYAQGRNIEKARARFGNLMDEDWFEFVQDDISHAPQFSFPRVDYIVHSAGIANPQMYGSIPVDVIEPNVLGTAKLLDFCVKAGIESFLYFSSGDVYGKVLEPDSIIETTVGGLDPLDEHSCYGESKRMGEAICAAYYRQYGIPTKIVRIGHTYGPTMDLESDPRVFSSFINKLIHRERIEILSDGRSRRAFCYISDAIAAYLLVLLKGNNGDAYNVCNTNEFLSISEFADIIANVDASNRIDVIYTSRKKNDLYIENVVNRDNKPLSTKVEGLGFSFDVCTKEGVLRTYKHFIVDKYKVKEK